ncbi:hypothetical protein H3C66_02135 [Patescibacteria group bacterium]|nr:hypothetical protein [Patescibacteria group bacterium]
MHEGDRRPIDDKNHQPQTSHSEALLSNVEIVALVDSEQAERVIETVQNRAEKMDVLFICYHGRGASPSLARDAVDLANRYNKQMTAGYVGVQELSNRIRMRDKISPHPADQARLASFIDQLGEAVSKAKVVLFAIREGVLNTDVERAILTSIKTHAGDRFHNFQRADGMRAYGQLLGIDQEDS